MLLVAVWGPPPTRAPLFPNEDKVSHLLGFAGLAGAWWCAFGRKPWAAALGLVFAVVTEVGQGYLPYPRSPEVGDAVADAVGVALGLVVTPWLVRRLPSVLRRWLAPDGATAP
ncbi:MAG: VanZ family protein [Myxococcota bacterium]